MLHESLSKSLLVPTLFTETQLSCQLFHPSYRFRQRKQSERRLKQQGEEGPLLQNSWTTPVKVCWGFRWSSARKLWLCLTTWTLPAQMEIIHFEIWRKGTKVADTEYTAPWTADEALNILRNENPGWLGKLTAKDSKVGLKGPDKLLPSTTYVLRLANPSGRSNCTLRAVDAELS